MMRFFVIKVFAAIAVLLACAQPLALAYSPANVPPEKLDEFRDVSRGLRCPTCTGISVLESDAPFSVQIKDIVAEQVAAGKSRTEIYDFFVQRYGSWILREPPKKGFHMLAWLLPSLFLLGGPVLVWWAVWRRRQTFDTAGIRSSDEILKEFDKRLLKLRARVE